MGNCGSAPPVADDPPRKTQKPASRTRSPPPAIPSSAQREIVSPQVLPSVSASKYPLNQPSEPMQTLSSRPKEVGVSSNLPDNDLTQIARKSKLIEVGKPETSAGVLKAGREGERVKDVGDGEDNDGEAGGGEWKVRRRVSRRLSLEVQKKPSGAKNTPLPPSAADLVAWEAEAESGLMKSTDEGDGISSSVSTAGKGVSGARSVEAGEGEGDAFGLTASKSRLGRESESGGGVGGDDQEEEAEREEMPGPWRVKRRGRRLSLEVEKPPDLALLAAIRRSSSAPIQGALARRVMQEEREREREISGGVGGREVTGPTPLFLPLPPPVSPGGGESAVTSPNSHSATVFDFAQDSSPDFDLVDDGEGEDGGQQVTTPASVKYAEAIVKATTNRGVFTEGLSASGVSSGGTFRAKRRKSRRLSLEIENKPDEEVLRAVRRTHSAPVTKEGVIAAIGEEAWAKVIAGKDPLYEDSPSSPSRSPSFQPSPATRGPKIVGERGVEGEEGGVESVGAGVREAVGGGDLVPTRTSSQEARVGAWGGGQVVDFGGDDEDEEDGEDDNADITHSALLGSIEDGKQYVKVNPRGTSRRRSMDVYKKAISAGESHVHAAQMAGLDPSIADYDSLTDAELDLMSPRELEERGGERVSADFASWKGGSVEGGVASGQSGFKKRWADYDGNTDSSVSDSNLAVPSDMRSTSRRFPDLSAFGNESQPSPSTNPVPGVSV